MSGLQIPNDLVLFHYTFSPYARRAVWYLTLRKIGYAQCMVPSMMPREVLAQLNVAYRRIPLLSHGRDVYCDTRLIFDFLETQFPPTSENPGIGPETVEAKALCKLLTRYSTDAGMFSNAVYMLPDNLPNLQDERWLKDRADLGLKKFSVEDRARMRPECSTRLRDLFTLLEDTLLQDGREWVLGTQSPTLADIEAVWVVHWLVHIPGSLDASLDEKRFPRTHAYAKRFDAEIRKRMKAFGKQPVLENTKQTADAIRALQLKDHTTETVDETDPLGLKLGDSVQVFPVDSGTGHKDVGKLVKLTAEEAVVKKQSGDTEIRVHVPRWGFRVQKLKSTASL